MFTAAAAEEIIPCVTIDGWAFDTEALHSARARDRASWQARVALG
jgi:hypothetical protein